MNIAYQKLFEVRILNKYYQDWISRDLAIVPTPATRQILANHQLLYRNTDGGLIVLARVNDQAKLQIPVPLTAGLRLVFELRLQTPHFTNFTNLPLEKKPIEYLNAAIKSGYYFTNLYNNPHAAAGPVANLKLLSKAAGAAVSATDQVVYWPKIANIHLPADANSFSLQLKNRNGVPISTLSVNETQPFRNHDADLRHVPPGYYLINLNGGTDRPIFLDTDFYQRAPFGLIELFHSADVPAGYRFVTGTNHDEPVFQTYHIWFNNRSATWRYVFPAGAPTNFKIEHADSGDKFTGQTQGAQVVYTSPNPLELLESYQPVSYKVSGDTFKLPNPDGTIVKPVLNMGGVITGFNAEVYL